MKRWSDEKDHGEKVDKADEEEFCFQTTHAEMSGIPLSECGKGDLFLGDVEAEQGDCMDWNPDFSFCRKRSLEEFAYDGFLKTEELEVLQDLQFPELESYCHSVRPTEEKADNLQVEFLKSPKTESEEKLFSLDQPDYNFPLGSPFFSSGSMLEDDWIPDSKQEVDIDFEEKEEVRPQSQKFTITVHIYTVEKSRDGPRPYQCDSEGCDKAFADSSNLIKHLRTHTKEKPYSCTVCQKTFSHSTTLKEHMNIHSKAQPYLCTAQDCNAKFSNISNYRRHLRMHSGEKPYTCEQCGKVFSQNSNLKNHIKAIHGKSLDR